MNEKITKNCYVHINVEYNLKLDYKRLQLSYVRTNSFGMRKIDRDVSEYYNQKLQLLLDKQRIIYIATRYMVTRGHN